MPSLCKKIQATKLFSDTQKVDLLAMLEDASEEDKAKLEDGIDTFDREYKKSMDKRKKDMEKLLAAITEDLPEEERKAHQDAIDEIRMGMDLLTA